MKIKRWEDIEIGDKMEDGSVITQVHPIHEIQSYKLSYGINIIPFKKYITLSKDHVLLCDISKISKGLKDELISLIYNKKIPKEMNYIINSNINFNQKEVDKLTKYLSGEYNIEAENMPKVSGDFYTGTEVEAMSLDEILSNCQVEEEITEYDNAYISDNEAWLDMRTISWLVNYGEIIKSNGQKIQSVRYNGVRKARCVSTDTGKYQTKELTHHNSVAVRNIIFHALTHSSDMSMGLIDLKQTEFSYFKDKEGIVGVANEVQEAAELLRIARDVMYKRNKEMSKLGITDFNDFKPQEPTEKINVAGVEMHENDKLNVKVDGQEKEMTAKELLEYIEGEGA